MDTKVLRGDFEPDMSTKLLQPLLEILEERPPRRRASACQEDAVSTLLEILVGLKPDLRAGGLA